ncbi:MAG: hydrogenase small subunit [Haloarculaceae archaeon]|jgi:hydrogenase small subunit
MHGWRADSTRRRSSFKMWQTITFCMSSAGTDESTRPVADGPQELDEIDVFWLPGEGCDGCSIATLGATNPGIEDLLHGHVPHIPTINLHHHELAVESGEAYVDGMREAAAGERDPYVVVVEGSVPNERLIDGDGFWISMGTDENGDPVRMVDWLDRLAPGAAAVIAIGTCASWGGVPAAYGNVTDAMGTMDYLGRDYRSQLDLPVINVPGCAPVGDNFIETVAHLLLYVGGIGPMPELDELGRPKWLFGETVHRKCERAGYYEEGDFAEELGSEKCIVTKGCWGPVVKCNMPSRRNLDGVGGCMNMGGKCIGCTMPGFPDKFTPFFTKPPGSTISTISSSILGGVMSHLRRDSMKRQDRETRWDDSYGPKERIYQWILKRDATYDRDRGMERRPGRSDD